MNYKNQGLMQLKQIMQGLKSIDTSMRENSICPICGKPKNGIVPAGKTIEAAGLCVCSDDDVTPDAEQAKE